MRRLLIDPLTDAGFRFPKGTSDDEAKASLNRIADYLGYASDTSLARLRELLLTKGEGSARCFWPCYATVVGWAEKVQPRPLEEVPELASWFGSAAGREALAGGRLVAEFEFWQSKKRPPIYPEDRVRAAERAKTHNQRRDLVRDRQARGVTVREDELQWAGWYDRTLERVEALVGSVSA
ncbi:hypothetical protein [Seohaeicola zhoushanensis]|uniref:hypothetical protein n=1 Tax=Seohaeicola zhoushanensis TaxID=1569283 RepID=UPI001E46D53E|nr:hypothetical protein [Seohaeicola zhoushanensis]